MDTLSAVTLAGETACALFDMLVDYIDDVDFLLSGFFHAFKERSCYVHRVTFFTLGTAVKNKYFHSVFSPSASQFYADIFIINPCESHVNPRSAEWIFSMLFSYQVLANGGCHQSFQHIVFTVLVYTMCRACWV